MKSDLEVTTRGLMPRTATVRRNGAPPVDKEAAAPIPWQERPAGCHDVVWRHTANPIIGRHHMPGVQGSLQQRGRAVRRRLRRRVPLGKAHRFPHLHIGWSDDGLDWHIEPEPIEFANGDPSRPADYAYDPRLCKIDGTYYITWCGGHNGPTISVAATQRLPIVRATGERVPAVQSQWRAVSAQDRRQVLHAEPAERRRPHAVRRHLPEPKPRHVPLGHASPRDAPRRQRSRPVVATHQDRRRPDPDRNGRRLAHDLSRRDGHVQRLCLQHGRGAARSR